MHGLKRLGKHVNPRNIHNTQNSAESWEIQDHQVMFRSPHDKHNNQGSTATEESQEHPAGPMYVRTQETPAKRAFLGCKAISKAANA